MPLLESTNCFVENSSRCSSSGNLAPPPLNRPIVPVNPEEGGSSGARRIVSLNNGTAMWDGRFPAEARQQVLDRATVAAVAAAAAVAVWGDARNNR